MRLGILQAMGHLHRRYCAQNDPVPMTFVVQQFRCCFNVCSCSGRGIVSMGNAKGLTSSFSRRRRPWTAEGDPISVHQVCVVEQESLRQDWTLQTLEHDLEQRSGGQLKRILVKASHIIVDLRESLPPSKVRQSCKYLRVKVNIKVVPWL